MRIADAYLIAGREEEALAHYGKASSLLEAADRPVSFDQPHFIRLRAPVAIAEEGEGGSLIARFNVTDDGDVRSLDAPADGSAPVASSIRFAFSRSLREAKLRPRIIDGKFVETTNVEFRLPVRGRSS